MPRRPNGRKTLRRLLLKLSLLILSICATLALLEIGVRIAKPQDLEFWDSSTFRRLEATSPHFVENIPNGHAHFSGVPVVINRYGLRGDEIAIAKKPNTVRILVVGDSITFGYGIPVESTYAKVLERLLNTEAAGKMQYEVLNAGTLGGSLTDYHHLLTQKAETLQPDIVLVGLNLNDIVVYTEKGAVSDVGAQWHSGRLAWTKRLSRFLLQHSQLYVFCFGRFKSSMYFSGVLDVNKARGMNFVTLTPPSAYQKEAWESSFRMLTKIAAFCRERGYRLVVVVFPLEMQLSAEELQFYREKYHLHLGPEALSGEPQQRLRDFAAKTGITLVDLLPAYRALNPEDLYLRNAMVRADPYHPSVKGNQVAAEEIFRTLKTTLSDPGIPAK